MPYLKLFHGRASPDDEMDGWGDDGPVFGPFVFFHTTYGSDIKFAAENEYELTIVEDLVYYDGMFYGEWSVFEGPPQGSDVALLTAFDPKLAEVPETLHRTSPIGGKTQPKAFTVHCYLTVRVPVKGIVASTPQDAARLAAAQFDWNEHHWQAVCDEEISEFLVDVEGAVDHSQSRGFTANFEELKK